MFQLYLLLAIHLAGIGEYGMRFRPVMALLFVNVMSHGYVSAYTSSTRQSMVALDRALKGVRGRLDQLYVFIRQVVVVSPSDTCACVCVCVFVCVRVVYFSEKGRGGGGGTGCN